MIRNKFDDFKIYIETLNTTESKKRNLISTYKRLQLWEDVTTKNILNWDKDFLIKLCVNGVEINDPLLYMGKGDSKNRVLNRAEGIISKSYSGMKSKITYINDVIKFFNVNVTLDVSDFKSNMEEKKDKEKNDFFTKEEIVKICNMFENSQDKFIVYGMFSGIRGSEYYDLTNMKINDIDFYNEILKLPSGGFIKMDGYLKDILIDVVDSKLGRFYYKLNRSGTYDRDTFYKLNVQSEYIVKTKPTMTNNNGLNPMSFQGMQTRLKGLSNITGANLKGVNLYRSGVVHRMMEIKKDWKQLEINDYLIHKNIKLSTYETHRLMQTKY